MATGTIVGNVRDFAGTAMPGLSPEVHFVPSGPAITSAGLYTSQTIMVAPTTAGGVTVDLETTDGKRPEMWFTVKIVWLWPDGTFHHEDTLPGRLYVPVEGGLIGDLLLVPWNPTLAWWGSDEPAGVPVANTLWLNPDTGELAIWSN